MPQLEQTCGDLLTKPLLRLEKVLGTRVRRLASTQMDLLGLRQVIR